jgi:macrolide transport system ATP-binding/permease protein
VNDEDFQDEIRAHLRIAAAEKISAGDDPESARLASLKEFGNVALTTEAARRVWMPRWLDAVHDHLGDIRYAARGLAKKPGFSLTVIGVLTLAIGLNAAVFTLLKTFALSPLGGVDYSARLAVVYAETSTGRQLRLSYPDYRYLRDRTQAFAGLFGSSLVTASLGRGRDARQVSIEMVTGNYFQVLGVRAQRGRTLVDSDDTAPDRHPVIVISDALWRRDLAGNPDVVGTTVDVNNARFTVVGVADASFHGTIVGYDVEAFLPVMMAAQIGIDGGLPRADAGNVASDRRAALLFPQGFLRSGTSLSSAAAEIDAASSALARDRPQADAAQRLKIVPFSQSPTGGQSMIVPILEVLSAMALLVLLIACANIAGLVLVRGTSRRGEIAVRLALGATRGRIMRLLVAENILLAVPAAIAGVVLARREIPVLVEYAERFAAPQRLFFNTDVDGFVVGFAVLVACGSALAFGLIPAVRSSRVDLVSVINEDASPRGASRGRLRALLVVAQVAVSLLLLVGSSLVTRSLDAARRTDPGFDAAHVTAIALDLKQNAYDEPRGRVFYRTLLDTMRRQGGVESAALAAYIPLAFLEPRAQRVAIEGYEPRKGEDLAFAFNAVTADYFRTLRIPARAGRTFDARDDETGAPVVIVNDTFAQRFWGGAANAVGKRVRVADGAWRTIVGVAADVKYARIDEAPRPYYYLPFFQTYRASMVVHVRGAATPDGAARPQSRAGADQSRDQAADEKLVDQVRARVAALDGDLPIVSARTLAERTSASVALFTFVATMLFYFGAAGMALAAMGTYGLVSYIVRQSTHEIGIRMALGASGLSVVRAFLGRGLRLGAIGAVAGLAASAGVTRLLGNVVFGVNVNDAASFARALAIVMAGVATATFIPAWRAARTNPLTALRHQ